MSETTGPVASQDEELPSPPHLETDPLRRPAPRWSVWIKSFLAANPFYLGSALLLLYGVYRVSVDSGFLGTERAELSFNFSSLQFYEILLVLTAIFLARRRLSYDSGLLVTIDSLVAVVPFILVSHAALIQQSWVWGFCTAGAILAIARFTSLQRFLRELKLPGYLLGCGAVVLAFNAAIPVAYRILHESKVGTKPTVGAAYELNEWSWLLLLPLAVVCVNLVPQLKATCGLRLQRRWLLLGFFLLWIAGTVTHLYSLGYVYDFDLRLGLAAPFVWVLTWTAAWRVTDFLRRPAPGLRIALQVIPFFTALSALFSRDTVVLLWLSGINVALYGLRAFLGPNPRVAMQFALASAAIVVATVQTQWSPVAQVDLGGGRALAAVVLGYGILGTALSRKPYLGSVGALAAALATGLLIWSLGPALHWAVQVGCVYFLLHSVRWDESLDRSAAAMRWVGALLWTAHAWVWVCMGEPVWQLAVVGTSVAGVWFLVSWIRNAWPPIAVLVGAAAVVVTGPIHDGLRWISSAPAGLLAVAGSFALLGIGTALAITRHRWHRPARG